MIHDPREKQHLQKKQKLKERIQIFVHIADIRSCLFSGRLLTLFEYSCLTSFKAISKLVKERNEEENAFSSMATL